MSKKDLCCWRKNSN